DDLTLPRDDAAAGVLLVVLAGVAVAGVEVVLRAPHVPLFFALAIGRRAARGAARAGTLVAAATGPGGRRWRTGGRRAGGRRSAGRCGRRRRALRRRGIGGNPAAILHAAVDLPRAFHAQLQLEVRRLAALPDEIDRSRR